MARKQTNSARDLLVTGLGQGPGPLHLRLARALRQAIRDGRLGVGEALPASRDLADDLGCSRWTVTQAYGQLVAEGYLQARTGSATSVAWSAGDSPSERSARSTVTNPPTARFDLAPGLPDLREFPRQRWADAMRDAVTTVPHHDLGYPPQAGMPQLRNELADYLRRTRGTVAGERDVTICRSVTDAVRRLCALLRDEGITAVGCEEPGWSRLRDVIAAEGMEVVPLLVDENGMHTHDLAAQHRGLRAVLVTPAHQFPTGVVLSPRRRTELLRWAHEVDGIVLEDDYDAEFRYDRRAVGTLQGMDSSRVVLLKSLSKMMSPAIGIGWTVTPPRWTERWQRDNAGTPPPSLDQVALAALLASGSYDRFLRAARHRYRRRRDVLLAELSKYDAFGAGTGIAAGLHLTVPLRHDVDPRAVVDAAADRSVRVADLDRYHATPGPRPGQLVLGYGNIADADVPTAVQHLAEIAEQER